MSDDVILKMEHIRKEFLGVVALDDIHFEQRVRYFCSAKKQTFATRNTHSNQA